MHERMAHARALTCKCLDMRECVKQVGADMQVKQVGADMPRVLTCLVQVS
jgi:hypothetical protein